MSSCPVPATTHPAEVLQTAMMKEEGRADDPNSGPPAEPGAVLNPPDLGLLKLTPPDLERLFIQSSGLVSAAPPPPHFLYYPKAASDEQEFAEGFVKALEDLHQQNQLSDAARAPAEPLHPPDFPVYTTLNDYANSPLGAADGARAPVHVSGAPPRAAAAAAMFRLQSARAVKDEPQTVPDMQSFGDSPPLSPIDMDNQERIKAERKKLRNRIAASKCRKRKLERISRLEDKVKTLKTQNVELASTASVLREQVAQLKQKVMNHVSSGCQLLPAQVRAY